MLKNKIKHWEQAGLLTADQAAAILTHERDRRSGRFGQGLISVGLFAIVMGFLSIIAANWHEIPDALKLGGHLVLNILAGLAVWKTHQMGRTSWIEGAVWVFFALILTMIALIGQVFQLDGSWAGVLLLWAVLGAPVIFLFGRTRVTAWSWILVFLGAIYYCIAEYATDLPPLWQELFILAISVFLPLALIADGYLAFMRKHLPVMAEGLRKAGLMLLFFNALAGTFYWRVDRGDFMADLAGQANVDVAMILMMILMIFMLAGLAIFIHAWIYKGYAGQDERVRAALVFIGGSLLVFALPLLLAAGETRIMGAVSFIAYGIMIGLIAQWLDMPRLVSFVLFVLAIRVYVIYLEVFGTLAMTGFGLIFGGLVLIGLIWGARSLNKFLKTLPKRGIA